MNNMSKNRAERRKMKTFEQIKNATQTLLFTVGYQRTSIRAITELADVGYGTFYLHFTDKDDAIWAVLHGWMLGWEEELTRRLADEVYPRREFLSWVIMFEQLSLSKQGFVEIFGRNGSTQLLQRYQDYMVKTHETNLHAGLYSSGIEIEIEFLAQFVVGALVRVMLWWVEGERTETPLEMAQLFYRVAYRQDPPEL
jgi:AcrR family transcriptional regulator